MVGKRRPSGGRAAEPAEREAAQAALAARSGALTLVRESAGKWQAGLAALIGLGTGAVGLGVRDTLVKLEQPYALLIGALLIAAFVAAFAAALCALYAGAGMPTSVRTSALDAAGHRAAKAAAMALRAGIALTCLSVFALAAATWLTWFSPERASTASVATVSTTEGPLCGSVEVESEHLLVTEPEAERVHVVALADVEGWEAVDACE